MAGSKHGSKSCTARRALFLGIRVSRFQSVGGVKERRDAQSGKGALRKVTETLKRWGMRRMRRRAGRVRGVDGGWSVVGVLYKAGCADCMQVDPNQTRKRRVLKESCRSQRWYWRKCLVLARSGIWVAPSVIGLGGIIRRLYRLHFCQPWGGSAVVCSKWRPWHRVPARQTTATLALESGSGSGCETDGGFFTCMEAGMQDDGGSHHG